MSNIDFSTNAGKSSRFIGKYKYTITYGKGILSGKHRAYINCESLKENGDWHATKDYDDLKSLENEINEFIKGHSMSHS